MSLNDYINKTFLIEGEKYNFQSGSVHFDYTEANCNYYKDKTNHQQQAVVCETDLGISITAVSEDAFDTAVRRRKTRIKNVSDHPITLNKAATITIEGIAENGKWFDHGRIKIHYLKCCWQGEFQWRTTDLIQESIFPVSTHKNSAEIIFSSIGAWSTCKYYPIVFIEDTLEHKTYFFEVESSTGWNIVIYNAKTEDNIGSIGVTAGAANILVDGWQHTLKPNETYETVSVIFGEVDGGVSEATNQLIKYKRAALKGAPFHPPVVYNCYMNGIWSHPTDQKLIPLIDAAAELGVEVFCIDAGWHSPITSKITLGIGDWCEDKSRFKNQSLKDIVDYIKNKGMTAGLWLELEACQLSSKIPSLDDSSFLKRNTKPIGKDRLLLNFNSEKVKNYLFECIKKLYQMGIRFIKNDYNQTVGIGFEEEELSLSEALKRNSDAFLKFIDEVKTAFPDLMIENCASGAMRADHNTLSHFDTQSISDQEIYYHMPSIISGAACVIPPEKLGIWATPYPVPFKDRFENIQKDYFGKNSKDEVLRQTVFNMCNAFMGGIYLSGRIDLCDHYNMVTIKNAIKTYKNVRDLIPSSEIVLCNGHLSLGEEKTYSMLLNNSEKNMAILSVWNINDFKDNITIDLSILNQQLKIVTPLCILQSETNFELKANALSVDFKYGKSAAAFLLEY